MKFQRQAKILQLIEQYDIVTQEEMSQRLQDAGYITTQATVSRDIKDLRLIKVLTASGTYKYAVPSDNQTASFSSRLRNIFKESVTQVDSAKNIVVIKTLPGLAHAAASAIDNMSVENVVGTLAGDDTVMIVMRDDESARVFCDDTSELLK